MNSNGKAVNWATVVLVAITGGGNWLATKSSSDLNTKEIERATEEIHALYPKLNEAIERQKQMQESLDKILARAD